MCVAIFHPESAIGISLQTDSLPEISQQAESKIQRDDYLTEALFLLSQDQNVFDSKKKVKLTNAEGVEYKLATKQLQAIDFNKALLAMYTNQVAKPPPPAF